MYDGHNFPYETISNKNPGRNVGEQAECVIVIMSNLREEEVGISKCLFYINVDPEHLETVPVRQEEEDCDRICSKGELKILLF